jgi:acyl-CoA reductase-like NAD-dependent aldehyde dehydrogenase
MTEQTEQRGATDDSWREVGQQFQILGKSLAAAFRASLNCEQTRAHLHSLQSGIQSMANELGQTMTEAAASPCAQDVRIKAEKAATTARFATEEALQEARPQILATLKQMNRDLERIIQRTENGKPDQADSA